MSKKGESMPKKILMDEFHVSVTVPSGLSKAEYDAIHRSLKSTRFQKRLREGMRNIFRRYPSLRKTRVAISR
jgi:hypothetical protein